jgi:hypothetical protein
MEMEIAYIEIPTSKSLLLSLGQTIAAWAFVSDFFLGPPEAAPKTAVYCLLFTFHAIAYVKICSFCRYSNTFMFYHMHCESLP